LSFVALARIIPQKKIGAYAVGKPSELNGKTSASIVKRSSARFTNSPSTSQRKYE